MCKITNFITTAVKTQAAPASKSGGAKFDRKKKQSVLMKYLQDISGISEHFTGFKHGQHSVNAGNIYFYF